MDVPARRTLSRFGMRMFAGIFALCVGIMAAFRSETIGGDPWVWTAVAATNIVALGMFIVQLSQRTLRWSVLTFYTWAVARAISSWPAYNAVAIYTITCMLLWHVYRCVRMDLPPERAWPWEPLRHSDNG